MGKLSNNQAGGQQRALGPTVGPADYAMAIIPALIKGVAGGIIGGSPGVGVAAGLSNALPSIMDVRNQGREYDAANAKDAELRAEKAAKEAERRGVNSSILRMQNLQGMDDLSGASPDQLRAIMDTLGSKGAQRYTNNFMNQMGFGLPEDGEGIPGESYQSSLLGQMGPLARQAYGSPTSDQINELLNSGQMPDAGGMSMMDRLRSGVPDAMGSKALEYSDANPNMQLKRATMPGAIGATNAKNQADIETAVPSARADLQGKKLRNQGTGLRNQGIPLENQGKSLGNRGKQLNNQKMEMLIQEHIKEQADLQDVEDFQKNLQQLAGQEQDPIAFRKKALYMLQKVPVPNEPSS